MNKSANRTVGRALAATLVALVAASVLVFWIVRKTSSRENSPVVASSPALPGPSSPASTTTGQAGTGSITSPAAAVPGQTAGAVAPATPVAPPPSPAPNAPAPAAGATSPVPPKDAEINYATEYVIIGGHKAHPTRLLAKLKSEVSTGDAQPVLQPLDLRVETEFPLTPRTVVLNSTAARPSPVANAEEARDRGDVLQDRIKLLLQSGRFEYVEPDYLRSIDATPSDQAFSGGSLWALRNTGQSGGVSGADIDAVRAWDLTTGSTSTIVAVIDTGIRYTHTDLAAQMWQNPGEIAGNGVDDDHDGYVDNVYGIDAITNSGNPNDDHGHGTHCAGTIGGSANGSGQIVGVAWQVRLMACRFMRKTVNPTTGQEGATGSDSDAIKCINFAVSKGARILSNSWGGSGFNTALRDAIAAARNQGVLFLAAAGNGGSDGVGDNNDAVPQYPSNYNVDNIIAVAAIDRQDKLASFSNYGATTVDIGAPGVSILSSIRTSDTAYASWDGTSMATPHVAGVAALVLSRFPSISLAELRQRILDGAVPINALRNKTVTGGRLNAFNAVNALADGILEVSLSPTAGSQLLAGTNVTFVVQVSDLSGVSNATVTGVVAGQPDTLFANGGVAPDTFAGDNLYSAAIAIPPGASSFTLRIDVSAPGKAASSTTHVFSVLQPAVNDLFAAASTLTGSSATATGSNAVATKEPGEPAHAGFPGGKSVWWKWTAPSSGTATVKTDGSAFDTILGVYTGNAVNALTTIASDDDSGTGSASSAAFNATAGTTYFIAVDGYNALSGSISLALTLVSSGNAPANDNFAAAANLSGSNATTSGSNLGATKQAGEPDHAGNAGGKSVWWNWTAPATGLATIATDGSGFDTTLAVYTGSSVSGLGVVVSDNDGGEGQRSQVSFNAVSGTIYRIAVDGFNGAAGSIALSLSLTIPPAVPANDNFAGRTTLSGTNVSVSGGNSGATKEPGENDHAGNAGGKSVWWSWTAPSAGSVTVTTAGSNFDTLLGVYTGTAVGSLTVVASNNQDPAGGNTSRVGFTAVAGVTYQIAVDGSNTGLTVAAGTIALNVTLSGGAAASNDLFANRTALSGAATNATGTNIGATKETGEPGHAGDAGGKSVWWTWTAPSSGTVTIATDGSTFDTILGVYTGSSVSALSVVASDDDNGIGSASSVTFAATAGVVYQIAVDGYAGASGNIALSIVTGGAASAPANDLFANRIALSGTNPSTTGTSAFATKETNEPFHAGYIGGKSVWWTWTAPSSGSTIVTTAGSNFDTLLAVYTGGSLASLTEVAGNDEDPAGGNTSRLTFAATAGTVYHIAVDGYGGASGSIALNLSLAAGLPPPANDNFANRTALTGTSLNVTGSNVNATRQTGEPLAAGLTGGRSVWWSWTAPSAGTVILTTLGSNFDTILTVHTGTAINTQTLVGGNDQDPVGGDSSRVIFAALAGVTYNISVEGFQGDFGDIKLNLELTPVSPAPVNDQFANRIPISGTSVNGTNILATRQNQEPFHADAIGGRSVWWSWTPQTTGRVSITTAGSNFDTLLGVYIGSSVSALTTIASNDEDPAGGVRTSEVSFLGVAGTTYSIAVDGYYADSGTIALAIVAAPPNDLFANRLLLFGASPTTTGTNVGATRENFEPFHADLTGGKSVWWAWTAPATGNISITTAGSSFDTMLGVYTGTNLISLTTIAANDQDESQELNTSRVTFIAIAGTTYQIAVDGYFGETGTIALAISAATPAVAPTISSQPVSQSGAVGSNLALSVNANGTNLTYAWEQDGFPLFSAVLATLTMPNLQPVDAGLYRVVVANALGALFSQYTILGVTTTAKVTGGGIEVGVNIQHPNGNVYDQVLLTGASAIVTADPGQVTRTSYVDLSNDIVQIEFSGPGSLAITLDAPAGPAVPVNYNQPTVQYMKGHASLVLSGATENTHLSIFTVGTLNAVNSALFKPGVSYDGVADVGRLSILSPTGRMGSIRFANAQFLHIQGVTGLYAPGVRFGGPVNIHDVIATDAATPMLITGTIDSGRINITGGFMLQINGRAVQVGDAQKVTMAAGVDSHNRSQPTQTNLGRYERNGVDVTAQITAP